MGRSGGLPKCCLRRLLPGQGNRLFSLFPGRPDNAVERDRLSVGAGDLQGGIAGGRDTEGHLLDVPVVLWLYQYIPAAFGAWIGGVFEVFGGELDASLGGIDGRRIGPSEIGQIADDRAFCYFQIKVRCELPDAPAHGHCRLCDKDVIL